MAKIHSLAPPLDDIILEPISDKRHITVVILQGLLFLLPGAIIGTSVGCESRRMSAACCSDVSVGGGGMIVGVAFVGSGIIELNWSGASAEPDSEFGSLRERDIPTSFVLARLSSEAEHVSV